MSAPPARLFAEVDMHPNEKRQQFSHAYVRAVAAAAGIGIAKPETDDDSVDLICIRRAPSGKPRSPYLQLQLKCTSEPAVTETSIKQLISRKNYDELRVESEGNAHLLVVVVVPSDAAAWTKHSEAELALRYCGYWRSLRGLPATENEAGIQIEIPRTNLFSVQQLTALMDKIAAGERP